MRLAFIIAAVAGLALSGCCENPSDPEAGTDFNLPDDRDPGRTGSPVTVEKMRFLGDSALIEIKADKELFFTDPDTISAVGLYGDWKWEEEAVSDARYDPQSHYVIRALVEPGVYFFNLKGPGRVGWADLEMLEKSHHWIWYDKDEMIGWIVISVDDRGEVYAMTKEAFKKWLEE